MLTLSEERKFHLIFAHESESSRERKYQGAKVPCMELSFPGAKVRGNGVDSSSVWEGGRQKSRRRIV